MHPLTFTVRARADAIATFRFIAVALMETLARWVPTTPELEVKVLFGRHLWDLAQHADAFGRRTAELRLAPQASRDPTPAFRTVLNALGLTQDTTARVGGFYDDAVPLVDALYREYLTRTDHLLDEPSVRILERAIGDLARLRRDRDAMCLDHPEVARSGVAADGRSPLHWPLDIVVDFRPAQVGVESA
jgi:hypothetical protein